MMWIIVGRTIPVRMHSACTTQKSYISRKRFMLGGSWHVTCHTKAFFLRHSALLFSRPSLRFFSRSSKLHHIFRCHEGSIEVRKEEKLCLSTNFATSTSSSTKFLDVDTELINAIIYEAEMGYMNVKGKTMRFSDFLYSRLMLLWPSLNCQSFGFSLEEVKNYTTLDKSARCKLLDKVCPIFGFLSANHMGNHIKALRDSSDGLSPDCSDAKRTLEYQFIDAQGNLREMDSEIINASLRFPCLILGSSPEVSIFSATEDNVQSTSCLPSVEVVDTSNFSKENIFPSENVKKVENKQPGNILEDLKIEETERVIPEKCFEMPEPLSSKGTLDLPESDAKGGFEMCQHPDLKGSMKKIGSKAKEIKTVSCFLDFPIRTLQGLTPKQRRMLDENGLFTVRKLLCHFPRTYVNIHDAQGQLEDGLFVNFTGMVASSRGYRAGSACGIHEVIVECQIPVPNTYIPDEQIVKFENNEKTVYLYLKRFFRAKQSSLHWILKNMMSKYKIGDLVAVCGKIKALQTEDHFEMRDYDIEILDGDNGSNSQKDNVDKGEQIQPIYSSKGDCGPKDIGKCIKRILPLLPLDLDPIPADICHQFNLMNLHQAYVAIHCPIDKSQADSARRRFIFDDFFYLQMGLLYERYKVVNSYRESFSLPKNTTGFEVGHLDAEKWSQLTLKVMKSLPFSLTNAQLKAASEIIWELRRPVPMNHLLVGEVGSGKTVVALLAAIEVIDSGYQVAFMVPTEILAVQHYRTIVSILEKIDTGTRPSVALLTGSTSVKDSRLIRMGLESGDISIVVGTHSLISENVNFRALCLAIIDEQQRFGVEQKGRFSSKVCTNVCYPPGTCVVEGESASADKVFFIQHVLVMTATPIPRTLALAIHGDMSLSVINEFPPGRKPIKTIVFEENDFGIKETYQMVQSCLVEGGKVFVVYPIIEESKHFPELHAAKPELKKLSATFEGYSCGIVHGRMSSSEKEMAIQDFRDGKTQILVATQVIEVGIDIPEATMIVVMDAERYGMSQLHQLRGRIGRGQSESTCIVLSSSRSTLKRLKILEGTTNGFKLAEADLQLRGPGQLFGTRQSGHIPEFMVARLETDGHVLEEARIAAMNVLEKYQGLDSLPMLKAELSMRYPGLPLTL